MTPPSALDPEELRRLKVLRGLSREAIDTLLARCQLRVLRPGEVLLSVGQANRVMYIVVSGKLSVHLDSANSAVAAFVERGEVVGELGVLEGRLPLADVAAVEETHVLGLDDESFWVLVNASHDFAANLLVLLARRVRRSNSTIKAQARETATNELRLNERMMRERHESIAQMVVGVAHEVNTPLGVANAAAATLSEIISSERIQKLRAQPELAEDLADIAQGVSLIQRNIARADQLIRNFKNLSTDQMVDRCETIDLSQRVQEIVELWKPEARRSHIEVAVQDRLDPTMRQWIGYGGHLTQVLLNLLGNAKVHAYGSEGGSIDVALSSSWVDDRATFVIEVSDRGAGIPEENVPLVFDAFFTTGRGKGGTGLGLAIVKNILASIFGGTIDCRSELGRGTTFTIRFSHCGGQRPQDLKDPPLELFREFVRLSKRRSAGEQLAAEEQRRLAELRGAVDRQLDLMRGSLPFSRTVPLHAEGAVHSTTLTDLSPSGAIHLAPSELAKGTRVRAVYRADPPLEVEAEIAGSIEIDRRGTKVWRLTLRFDPDFEIASALKQMIVELILERVGNAPKSG